MTGLPQGWAEAKIAELLDVARGGSPRPIQAYLTDEVDGLNWIKISDATSGGARIQSTKQKIKPSGLSKTRAVKPGDFLLSNSMSFGKPYICDIHGCIHDGWLVLGGVDRAFDPDFLYHCLRSDGVQRQFSEKAAGSTVQNLNSDLVREVVIPLPPLPEQRRIVRKLDTLSARSTTARTHLTAIEKLVERYKRSVLGQFFPVNLRTKPLGVRCTKIGSGATPRGGKNVYLPKGTPLIRSQNVRFEGFDWDGLAFISDEHADELRNVAVRTGDVLLNITGASIGRVCLTPEEMDGARVNQHVSIIRPIPQELDAGFVQHFLSSPSIQNWIWNENYGVTRQALTKGMIEEISIPDVSLEEQREIVRRIETAFAKIDRLAAEAAKALKLLGHLDQRILAKAFAGDLVPQDPNDEPAETLLARIREARAAAPKSRRGRK